MRAIFGHAANADLERLRRIWPGDLAGRITDAVLEPRLGRRRLDLLVSAGDRTNGRPGRGLVVEAKVGAVVDVGTLADYLASAAQQRGPSVGCWSPRTSRSVLCPRAGTTGIWRTWPIS